MTDASRSPLISIIIPVYNGAATIGETIVSLQQQTHSPLEILVIDDGSTDDTVAVLQAIAEPRLRVVSYANAGQAVSRNRGLELARGEYISFIDADDLWTPDKLADQLAALMAQPRAAVAYSWTDHIDQNRQFLRHGPQLCFEGDVFRKLLYSDFIGSGSNILVRRSAIVEVGGFDPSLPPAEDWDCWLRLAQRFEFVVVPKPQILYRVSSQSSSFNVWRMERSSLRTIARAFATAPASAQPIRRICLGHRYKYLTYKTIDAGCDRRRALTGVRYWLLALWYDPTLLRRRVIWKVALKILAILLLPQMPLQRLMRRYPKPFDTESLLYRITFGD
ncbi:MAG: glycosyltransferase [Oscillatoriales cyanobacterium]|nr:MAG: glycosyltransferase [Oscillatoriales cyanobacterium]